MRNFYSVTDFSEDGGYSALLERRAAEARGWVNYYFSVLLPVW